MKFNQFNPTPEEVEEIKAKNQNLPIDERICYKCGHQYVIAGWCDWCLWNTEMRGNWENVDLEDVEENGKVYPPHACCDMECSYL